MRKFLIALFLAGVFYVLFGLSKAPSVAFAFVAMNSILGWILNGFFPETATPNPTSTDPLSDKAKEYLANRVEELNIHKIKKEDVKYTEYSEEEMKYMGMGKN